MWLFITATVLGQALPSKPLSESAFIEALQAGKKQVDQISDLDEAAKAAVRGLYDQALGEMAKAKKLIEETTRFEKLAAQAPVEMEQTKADLAALPAQPALPIPNDMGLPQLEQAISRREAELEQWRTGLAAVETELKGRAGRRVEVPKQIGAARQRLTDVNNELQTSAAGDESSPLGAARRMTLLARRRVAEGEILCCEKELAAYEARAELLPLRRDLLARRIAQAEQEIKQWQELVNGRRQEEAEQQARKAAREASRAHPAVRRLTEKNAALAEMRKSLAQHIAESTRQFDQVNKRLSALKDKFQRTREKVDTGLTDAIGLLLRQQREALPNLGAHRRQIAARQQTIRKGQLDLLELQDDRALLSNLDLRVQDMLQDLASARQASSPAELEAAVREALNAEREYLDALIGDHDTYFDKLVDLDNAQRQLIGETERYSQYIDELVLWIASAAPLGPADVHYAGDALWWLAGPEASLEVGRTLVADARRNTAVWLAALGVILLWAYWRRRFRARVAEIGPQASRGSYCRFLPTLEVTSLTVLAAAGWPALTWYFGWRLTAAADASELCKALGPGLTETARVFLALELLRHICCLRGLGESHFGWSASALKLLRQNIRWFSLPMLALMCVAVAMAWQDNDRWDASLGRVCFITALVGFSLALHRVLRPAGAVFQFMIVARRGGWLDRCRYVWYPLIVLTPTALAALAAVGYHYTARQLVIRLILTAYVLVGGLVCRALLLRWTLMNQRKLAIEQARQRRAAQNEASSSEEAADLPASAVPQRDLAAINAQTRRLVEYSLAIAGSLALWCAWVDVLPALGILDRVAIWHETTLAHLGLAALVLVTTVIAAKNIPGLLEMAVLQHLPFDAGVRYAVATIFRYVITFAGLLICFAALGVGWSKVQWLVAAMSLGLGFGLQEIFANFVSGLIILFERPIRVGDVVTIDDVSGMVSRIRIRATTIIDWNRKELIIPNKEFITGRVLNWTLSDPINRVVVNVGVAYGSDTERAAEILMKVARNHPHVLDDPPPRVTLESFGDSALNFVLRCFLPNLENRLTIIHELHMAVDREFRAAGIEIAFPQQDIHVRSIDLPLPILQPAVAGGNVSWPSTTKVA